MVDLSSSYLWDKRYMYTEEWFILKTKSCRWSVSATNAFEKPPLYWLHPKKIFVTLQWYLLPVWGCRVKVYKHARQTYGRFCFVGGSECKQLINVNAPPKSKLLLWWAKCIHTLNFLACTVRSAVPTRLQLLFLSMLSQNSCLELTGTPQFHGLISSFITPLHLFQIQTCYFITKSFPLPSLALEISRYEA